MFAAANKNSKKDQRNFWNDLEYKSASSILVFLQVRIYNECLKAGVRYPKSSLKILKLTA